MAKEMLVSGFCNRSVLAGITVLNPMRYTRFSDAGLIEYEFRTVHDEPVGGGITFIGTLGYFGKVGNPKTCAIRFPSTIGLSCLLRNSFRRSLTPVFTNLHIAVHHPHHFFIFFFFFSLLKVLRRKPCSSPPLSFSTSSSSKLQVIRKSIATKCKSSPLSVECPGR